MKDLLELTGGCQTWLWWGQEPRKDVRKIFLEESESMLSQHMVNPVNRTIGIREMERGMDKENMKGRESSRYKSQQQERQIIRGMQVFPCDLSRTLGETSYGG